jgi:radical SAM superfamily enzyme YgiQ (UPF0313 family)
MKVLFFFKSDFSTIPLSIMTLSSQLKTYGHQCNFIDLRFEPDYIKSTLDFQPDIIAFSIVSFTWDYYQKLNLKIKKHIDSFSVFGGPHCSIYPDFINEDGVDAICVGEGEEAIVELAQRLEENIDITNIPNIWVKKEGTIYKNEIRNLVSDLDLIPFPDYEMINKYRFYRNSGMYYIMTSRGCPYNCSYCINHFYRNLYKNKGPYVRRRSIDNIIEELLIAKNKHNAKLIIFNDDIFTIDKKWLIEFAHKYKELISLPFDAYTRVDTIDKDIVETLSDMGCIALYFGIESGNSKLRNEILKRNISNKQIIDISLLIKKYNIKTVSFNMLNLPGESLKEALETITINTKSKVDNPMGFVFQPFPNIDLTNYAIKLDLIDSSNKFFHAGLIYGKGLVLNKDRIQISRLRYFFIIACKFPVIQPLVNFLIKLPLDFIYIIILTLSRAIVLLFVVYRPIVKQVAIHYLFSPYRLFKGFISRSIRKLKA